MNKQVNQIDSDAPLLVDFGSQGAMTLGAPGGTLGAGQLDDLTERSQRALKSAMHAIQDMSRRITATIESLPSVERPTTVELEFGLKLDADAGALIARAGAEASFTVKLIWEGETHPVPTIPHIQPPQQSNP